MTKIPDSVNCISGCEIERNGRNQRRGGGVCVYLKNSIPYKRLHELEIPNFESLSIRFRPNKLPRNVTNICICAVYHPPGPNNRLLKEHLAKGIDQYFSRSPNGGILILGDFNQFPQSYVTSLRRDLKQIVTKTYPSRKYFRQMFYKSISILQRTENWRRNR